MQKELKFNHTFTICTQCVHIVPHRHRIADSECGHSKNAVTNYITGVTTSTMCAIVNPDGVCATYEPKPEIVAQPVEDPNETEQ